MTITVTINKLSPLVKQRRRTAMLRLKRQLHRRGITYREVAAVAERSWSLAYHVLNGRKTSPLIVKAAQTLVEARDAAPKRAP